MPALGGSDAPSSGYELVHHYDQGDDEQQVDKATGNVEGQEAQGPEDEQDNCDSPKHFDRPFN